MPRMTRPTQVVARQTARRKTKPRPAARTRPSARKPAARTRPSARRPPGGGVPQGGYVTPKGEVSFDPMVTALQLVAAAVAGFRSFSAGAAIAAAVPVAKILRRYFSLQDRRAFLPAPLIQVLMVLANEKRGLTPEELARRLPRCTPRQALARLRRLTRVTCKDGRVRSFVQAHEDGRWTSTGSPSRSRAR